MPDTLSHDERTYKWDPTKSTPSCRQHFKELDALVSLFKSRNATSIVDFGCGNGRNARRLAQHFERLVLVETEGNIPLVKEWSQAISGPEVEVVSFGNFEHSSISADACLLSYVLHTIPFDHVISKVMSSILSNLSDGGLLALASPSGDSKYRADKVANAPTHNGGIVRLYDSDTFSFYRNYSRPELVEIIDREGFEVLQHLRGDHRNIILAQPKPQDA